MAKAATTPTAATLKMLQEGDQVLFRYCDADGKIHDGANPNGSKENIAGVCNKRSQRLRDDAAPRTGLR
jgi:phosphoribosylformylglycinamidine (FGAM) synthase-like amidotransferase family enzyme